MRRYRVLVALALASFLVVVQTGTAFASMIQAVEDSAMAGCPDCPDCPPMQTDATQCLAHCASHLATASASPLVVPPASSERVRTRQPMRKPMSPVPPPVAHSHPPPIRILYQSFQI